MVFKVSDRNGELMGSLSSGRTCMKEWMDEDVSFLACLKKNKGNAVIKVEGFSHQARKTTVQILPFLLAHVLDFVHIP